MAKVNRVNEICNAITEIRKNLESNAVKTPLLIERLKQEEQRLLNELYMEVRKKASPKKRTKAGAKQPKTNHHSVQGGKNGD